MDHPVWALKSVLDQAVTSPAKYTLFLADYWLRCVYEVFLATCKFAFGLCLVILFFMLLDMLFTGGDLPPILGG